MNKELIGFLLPPVIDLINNRIASSKVKYLISLLISIGLGALVNYDNLYGTSEILGSSAVIFAEAQTFYKLYWENSKPRSAILKRL